MTALVRPLLATLLFLALSCCHRAEPAHPALWEVTGPKGEQGWLFGTIHTLPKEAEWRSPTVSGALDRADVLVLEIAAIDDDKAMRAVFDGLAHSPGQPPLEARVAPALRPALEHLLRDNRIDTEQFRNTETWAAALMLAGVASKESDPGNGIDRAIVAARPDLPRSELEGTAAQLAIFDHMPEADQRVMLEETLRDNSADATLDQLAQAWRKGDMDLIARETRTGMMTDPAIRKALFTDRNRDWLNKLDWMLRMGRRPFVAVGAAHLAGPEGLPALLAARGWKVARIQ